MKNPSFSFFLQQCVTGSPTCIQFPGWHLNPSELHLEDSSSCYWPEHIGWKHVKEGNTNASAGTRYYPYELSPSRSMNLDNRTKTHKQFYKITSGEVENLSFVIFLEQPEGAWRRNRTGSAPVRLRKSWKREKRKTNRGLAALRSKMRGSCCWRSSLVWYRRASGLSDWHSSACILLRWPKTVQNTYSVQGKIHQRSMYWTTPFKAHT